LYHGLPGTAHLTLDYRRVNVETGAKIIVVVLLMKGV